MSRDSVDFTHVGYTYYMKHIGLYFGSFNPIHDGHIRVAERVLEQVNTPDEIWFVVSPENPDKPASSLAPEEHRAIMVEIATQDKEKIIVSRAEFDLPRPSYTYQTLRELHFQYPEHRFSIIGGSDVINTIPSWEYADEILQHHLFAVCRYEKGIDQELKSKINCTEITDVGTHSATSIRDAILENKTPAGLPEGVLEYIKKHQLYR